MTRQGALWLWSSGRGLSNLILLSCSFIPPLRFWKGTFSFPVGFTRTIFTTRSAHAVQGPEKKLKHGVRFLRNVRNCEARPKISKLQEFLPQHSTISILQHFYSTFFSRCCKIEKATRKKKRNHSFSVTLFTLGCRLFLIQLQINTRLKFTN